MTKPTRASRLIRGGLAALAVVTLLPISATAESTGRHTLKRVTGKSLTGTPVGQRKVDVVLKMSGEPVAVVRSRAPNKQLAAGERDTIERSLRASQDAIVPSIRHMGGTVLAQFQHALNGIKVRGTPAQIHAFAGLPGVVGVKAVRKYHLVNAESVPFIGAPAAWQGPPGLRGEHVRLAVIDTGVDYTHANFGGPGTTAAFNAAFAADTSPADPSMFGPNAPKVKGGTDLVGDAYNADDPTSVPAPDPNPLDCNGHGSHTSGTATGFGVTADGKTFTGPYNAGTPGQSFIIGPGVAPKADLYMVRVFGCSGSTNVVVDAIDWAVAHDMQVISMSLGSDFGTADDADAEASENAVNSGVVVVASAGNAGTNIPYVVGTPSVGEKVISVAAVDSHASFPAEALALTPSGNITALDSNGITAADGTTLPVVVLPDTAGTGSNGVSLGCDPAEYVAAGVTGKLVVTARGTCARVARAIYGQQAGAAAVALINNAPGYPPYEGPINSNPDTGVPYTVTIPFLGVQGPGGSADGSALQAATAATLSATTIANPTFRKFASFSSAGPREFDGHLKPDISAPGVSIFSTAVGTGNQGEFLSGTSMAAPHVAGSAALTVQAHPSWDASDVANAVVNTADASQVSGYAASLGGNGLVQPFPATRTSVTAHSSNAAPSVSFGVSEFTRDFTGNGSIVVENHGSAPASFTISVVQGAGSAHTATVSPTSITVGGHGSRNVNLHLSVPLATVGDSSGFRQVQGRVVLTPTQGNNSVALSVPYYLVPRARSQVNAHLGSAGGTRVVNVANRSSGMTGTADFYAWGLRGSNSSLSTGLRAVGVQSFDYPGLGQVLVFAVNTFGKTSNQVTNVYDILVDVDGDGTPDYDIEAADFGLLTTGTFSGEMVTAVFNLATGGGVLEFDATAPTDGSTILMPIVAADAGITSTNPRFSYVAQSYDQLTGITDAIATPAKFNAFGSAISNGDFEVLPPGASVNVPLVIDRKEFRTTPALGQLVISLENANRGGGQALLVPLDD
jgi:minor extracellular serine protease Vpr